ncbi:heavy-metal-associated domain-containing protein [Candidatus Gottesmanbacteria bacterium]|nr:heavy-metal-associated domain-containing protein [Candidatus Gottesmanbacteria bacterium]
MKKTYKIKGMHCPSCAMLIEGELEDAGMRATCSYAKQTVEVEVDGGGLNEKKVREAVVKAGYGIAEG